MLSKSAQQYRDSLAKTNHGFFSKSLLVKIREAQFRPRSNFPGGDLIYGVEGRFKESVLNSDETQILARGVYMEEVKMAFSDLNDEIKESRDTLRDLLNEIRTTSEAAFQSLADFREEARKTRMSLTFEMQQSLSALRDIRKFFLDDDYKEEIQRLKHFIDVCNELKQLKADGTLDEVSNTIIGLSIREKK